MRKCSHAQCFREDGLHVIFRGESWTFSGEPGRDFLGDEIAIEYVPLMIAETRATTADSEKYHWDPLGIGLRTAVSALIAPSGLMQQRPVDPPAFRGKWRSQPFGESAEEHSVTESALKSWGSLTVTCGQSASWNFLQGRIRKLKPVTPGSLTTMLSSNMVTLATPSTPRHQTLIVDTLGLSRSCTKRSSVVLCCGVGGSAQDTSHSMVWWPQMSPVTSKPYILLCCQ